MISGSPFLLSFFFFNDTATTEIYTLSLHDALPIYSPERDQPRSGSDPERRVLTAGGPRHVYPHQDRKSTRLNSSHLVISYAVFCLKKKQRRPYLLYNRRSALDREPAAFVVTLIVHT